MEISAPDAAQMDVRSPAGSPPKAAGTPRLPFSITIDALDRRRAPFKRYETIRSAVLADVGGEDIVTEVQRQLISKFASLALQLEMMEAAALEGTPIDLDLFGRCAGHLRRIAETLGIERKARDITPLRERLAAEADVEEDVA